VSVTRLQIRQQVARDSHLGVLLAATTDGAADFTTFVDGSVRAVAADLVILDEGAPIVITSTGTTAAVWGEESRISSTAITSAGIITVAPAFSAKVKAQQTGEAWHRDLVTVQTVNDAIEWAVTKVCSRWAFPVLTFLKDGDFWKKTIDTAEWAVTNAIQSRVAFSFPNFLGRYIHRVTNSSAGGYAYQAIDVNEGEVWHFDVLARAYTGTAEISAYDVTNSATITLNDTEETDLGDWVWIINSFEVPSGCRSVQIRLGAEGASDVADYGLAAVWPNNARELPFQARITSADQVYGCYKACGRETIATVRKQRFEPWPRGEPHLYETPFGLVAKFDYAVGSQGPVFYAEKTYYDIGDSGTATASASTTLTDSKKAWTTNQWVGARVWAEGKWMTVTSNTATILTGAAWNGGTPSSTASYTIQGDLGTTDCPLEYASAVASLKLANDLYGQAERAEHVGRAEGFVNPWARLRKETRLLAVLMDKRHGAVQRTLEQYSERV